jgi:hypothetical protein
MVKVALKIARRILAKFLRPIIDERFRENINLFQSLSQVSLRMSYSSIPKGEYRDFSNVGFKVFSQFEEDGILLYIFSRIGTTNKRVLELGSGSARECMASNLLINHFWNGFLVDGNPDNKVIAEGFFKNFAPTFFMPPRFLTSWITAENVNQICRDFELTGEIDFLSLDIDGNDYWVLSALSEIQPRVICVEVQNRIPHSFSYTRPYDPKFDLHDFIGPNRSLYGASLKAFQSLLSKRGYVLIGASHNGVNAFFAKKDLVEGRFPEVTVESALDNTFSRMLQKEWISTYSKLDWVDVSEIK